MNGVDFIKTFRRSDSKTRIFIVTGRPDPAKLLIEGLEAQISGINVDHLLERIQQLRCF